eukprot:TRINITY_DN2448_c0_g1_i4.p1 TRINITY_DN2448_c0_g1~~TRINITY_DN2448_c0_g1_i4.p1  ORF type:complete len:811 (-),score=286.08 TRINITY_DN2448_c0_g1_i4:79-2511(-)
MDKRKDTSKNTFLSSFRKSNKFDVAQVRGSLPASLSPPKEKLPLGSSVSLSSFPSSEFSLSRSSGQIPMSSVSVDSLQSVDTHSESSPSLSRSASNLNCEDKESLTESLNDSIAVEVQPLEADSSLETIIQAINQTNLRLKEQQNLLKNQSKIIQYQEYRITELEDHLGQFFDGLAPLVTLKQNEKAEILPLDVHSIANYVLDWSSKDNWSSGDISEASTRSRIVQVGLRDDRNRVAVTVSLDPKKSVKEFCRIVNLKARIPPPNDSHYGIFLINPSDDTAQWMDESKQLSHYNITKRSVMEYGIKPKLFEVKVNHLNNDNPLDFRLELQWNKNTTELMTEIIERLGLEGNPVDWVLQTVGKNEKILTIIPWAPLMNQMEAGCDILYLKKKEGETAITSQEGEENVNIWDEKDPRPVLTTTEGGFTLNELILQLTSIEIQGFNLTYMNTFLSTFESFTSQEKFTKKLIERFRIPENSDLPPEKKQLVRMKICTVLKHWLSKTQYIDAEVMSLISHFIEGEMAALSELEDIRGRLKKSIASKKGPRENRFRFLDPPPEPLIGKVPEDDIFKIEPLEIARQLTLSTWTHWSEIQPIELFNQAWSKPRLQHLAPNVLAMIESFNSFSVWVSTAIVSEKKIKNRAKVFGHLIKIAECLKDLKNFHMLTATISGFNNSAILRLKHTRAMLSKKQETSLVQLEELTSMEGSFKHARVAVDNSVPPCIPYVGTYLMDLTFIDETSDFVSPGRINFEKRKLVYSILSKIAQKQSEGYNLKRVPYISNILKQLPNMDEKVLYDQSLECEPRNATKSTLT